MNDPFWLSTKLIQAMHNKQILVHGGISGTRDLDLLESALSKPHQVWHYTDPKPDLCTIAAAYAFGLVKNHAFLDGNKRTAHMAYRVFLAKNGVKLVATREDKYDKMIALAAGTISEADFAVWLRSVTTSA